MHNFEVFQRTDARRRSREPTVTVQRRGQLSLSPAAVKALGTPEAVTFLVSREERLLGFRAAKTVRRGGRQKAPENGSLVRSPGATVSATYVLRYLEADLSASRRYPLQLLDGVHCINLGQPGTVVTSNRSKG